MSATNNEPLDELLFTNRRNDLPLDVFELKRIISFDDAFVSGLIILIAKLKTGNVVRLDKRIPTIFYHFERADNIFNLIFAMQNQMVSDSIASSLNVDSVNIVQVTDVTQMIDGTLRLVLLNINAGTNFELILTPQPEIKENASLHFNQQH